MAGGYDLFILQSRKIAGASTLDTPQKAITRYKRIFGARPTDSYDVQFMPGAVGKTKAMTVSVSVIEKATGQLSDFHGPPVSQRPLFVP